MSRSLQPAYGDDPFDQHMLKHYLSKKFFFIDCKITTITINVKWKLFVCMHLIVFLYPLLYVWLIKVTKKGRRVCVRMSEVHIIVEMIFCIEGWSFLLSFHLLMRKSGLFTRVFYFYNFVKFNFNIVKFIINCLILLVWCYMHLLSSLNTLKFMLLMK